MAAARRDPLPDALRALALLGVLIVNAVNYAVAPAGPTLGAAPADGLDAAALFVVAAFFQGKAYPLLACLFGMGLVWAARGEARVEAQRRFSQRQRRLLVLGVLHGTVLYFGDILTLYTLCAWTVWPVVHVRASVAVKRLRRAVWWAAAALTGVTLLAVLAARWGSPQGDVGPMARLVDTRTLFAFIELNASTFAPSALFGIVLVLPLLRLFMLAGIVAARLRLLTHPRWAAWRMRWWRRLAPVLIVNVAFGAAAVWALSSQGRHLWADAVSMLVGAPLSVWYVLTLTKPWADGPARWMAAIAPLGRRTLSVYVGHSAWCVVLFSGIGLAWQPGTPALLLMSIVLWLLLVWLAAVSTRRWPLESWMGRRS